MAKPAPYYKIAKALYDRSATLQRVAAPTTEGYQATKAWVQARIPVIKDEYRLDRLDVRTLVMDINACAGGGNSLDD